MKKVLLTIQAFLLWGISTFSQAQTEHYVGLAVSNVTGVSYRFYHNRWMAVADAGWLIGFRGMYASAGGMYELYDVGKLTKFFYKKFDDKGDIITANLGLGFYAQRYYSASVRQKKWAEALGYAAPFGALMYVENRWRLKAMPNWDWAMRFRIPLHLTEDGKLYIFTQGANVAMLAGMQLVGLYKF
ncbi:MAG: hypothetical protein LBO71_06695 [Prevotellaceae bacterium]|jgi:hypothetical protein|nr:hypothetical protein [Prevotellaceae bacterium]